MLTNYVNLYDPYVVVEKDWTQNGEEPIVNFYYYSSFLEAYDNFLAIIKDKTRLVTNALSPEEVAEGAPTVSINNTAADINSANRWWFSFRILSPKEALARKIEEWVAYCFNQQKGADSREAFVVNFQFIDNNDFTPSFMSIVFEDKTSKFCDWAIEWVRRSPGSFGKFVKNGIRKEFDAGYFYSEGPGYYCDGSYYNLKGYCYDPCGKASGFFQPKMTSRNGVTNQPNFGEKHYDGDDLPF